MLDLSPRPRSRARAGALVCAVALALGALTACGGDDGTEAAPVSQESPATPPPVEQTPEEAPEAATESAPVAVPHDPAGGTFDLKAIPLSEADLGRFPFFKLPDGYKNPYENTIVNRTRVPFWTGDRIELVVGRYHGSRVSSVGNGRAYSSFEMRNGIEQMLKGVGGVKITESKVDSTAVAQIPPDVLSEFSSKLGGDLFTSSDTVETYVVRQADRVVWVHVTSNNNRGAWMIAETDAL